jgi:hypothetical protein
MGRRARWYAGAWLRALGARPLLLARMLRQWCCLCARPPCCEVGMAWRKGSATLCTMCEQGVPALEVQTYPMLCQQHAPWDSWYHLAAVPGSKATAARHQCLQQWPLHWHSIARCRAQSRAQQAHSAAAARPTRRAHHSHCIGPFSRLHGRLRLLLRPQGLQRPHQPLPPGLHRVLAAAQRCHQGTCQRLRSAGLGRVQLSGAGGGDGVAVLRDDAGSQCCVRRAGRGARSFCHSALLRVGACMH